MADFDDFDLEDDTDFDGGDLVSKLRKQLKVMKKERDTAVAERDQFKTEQRSRIVSDAVVKAGFVPDVAQLIPTSIEPDAVPAWLEANGQLFAKSTPQPTPTQEQAPGAGEGQPSQTYFTPDELSAVSQVDALSGASSAPTPVGDLYAKIEAATTREELQQILRTATL